MKKNKLLILSLFTALMLASCNNGGITPSGGSGGGGSGGGEDDNKITVNFYIDYNAANANKEFTIGGKNSLEVWATQKVDKGAKVSKPADPTEAPLPEFPVFLGWSYKEVIDRKEDLWNFDTDTVNTETKTFSIFGIWVAEGEN